MEYIDILWSICIFIRLLMIFIIIKYNIYIILLIIGLGFMYKWLCGSNNEYQIKQVFWHETRIIHSIFYIIAGILLYNKNKKLAKNILLLDIIFSIIYRNNIK